MIGATVKKIDWKNLSYYDFIGFLGIGVIVLFASCISEGFGTRLMITGYR